MKTFIKIFTLVFIVNISASLGHAAQQCQTVRKNFPLPSGTDAEIASDMRNIERQLKPVCDGDIKLIRRGTDERGQQWVLAVCMMCLNPDLNRFYNFEPHM